MLTIIIDITLLSIRARWNQEKMTFIILVINFRVSYPHLAIEISTTQFINMTFVFIKSCFCAFSYQRNNYRTQSSVSQNFNKNTEILCALFLCPKRDVFAWKNITCENFSHKTSCAPKQFKLTIPFYMSVLIKYTTLRNYSVQETNNSTTTTKHKLCESIVKLISWSVSVMRDAVRNTPLRNLFVNESNFTSTSKPKYYESANQCNHQRNLLQIQ